MIRQASHHPSLIVFESKSKIAIEQMVSSWIYEIRGMVECLKCANGPKLSFSPGLFLYVNNIYESV